jgi:hypothetical protein
MSGPDSWAGRTASKESVEQGHDGVLLSIYQTDRFN